LRHPLSNESMDVPVTEPWAVAFLPTATMDSSGRLHIVWYDSTSSGTLQYARSCSSRLGEGFTQPVTIEDNAVMGGGWYPAYDAAGRRLREYIGIAVDGGRVHLAWTHVPQPLVQPSKVYVSYIDAP